MNTMAIPIVPTLRQLGCGHPALILVMSGELKFVRGSGTSYLLVSLTPVGRSFAALRMAGILELIGVYRRWTPLAGIHGP